MNDGVVPIISTPLVRVIRKEVHGDLIGWPAEQLSGREGCRSSFRVELATHGTRWIQLESMSWLLQAVFTSVKLLYMWKSSLSL